MNTSKLKGTRGGKTQGDQESRSVKFWKMKLVGKRNKGWKGAEGVERRGGRIASSLLAWISQRTVLHIPNTNNRCRVSNLGACSICHWQSSLWQGNLCPLSPSSFLCLKRPHSYPTAFSQASHIPVLFLSF